MAINDEIHMYDEGTELRFQVKDNGLPKPVQMATAKKLIMERPDGTSIVKDLSFITDGEDGLLKYVTLSTDFNQEGHWRFQLKLTFANGLWRSNVIRQYVFANLTEPAP